MSDPRGHDQEREREHDGERAGEDTSTPRRHRRGRRRRRSRVSRAIAAGRLAAGSTATMSTTLLLHGLPLLAHVLPHTPQLLGRFLSWVVREGAPPPDEADDEHAEAER